MPQPSATHVPPQNIEAEESVLGAMLVAEPALTRVIDEVKLNAEDFYLEKHAAIFRCAHALYAASKPVDELSVSEALVQRGEIEEAGGKHYVSELAAKVPAAGEAGRRAQRRRGAGPARRDRGGGRQALRLRAGRQGPRRRQRQALRRDRPAELAAAPPARRRAGDPGVGERARRRTARALRAGREAALRRPPQRAGERLPPALGDPPRRGRPAREALDRGDRDDRHAH